MVKASWQADSASDYFSSCQRANMVSLMLVSAGGIPVVDDQESFKCADG